MDAIIRHLTSGEHFLARLDESGDATMLSSDLPTYEARDEETREIDWSKFADSDLAPWDDEEDRWTADMFVVVERF